MVRSNIEDVVLATQGEIARARELDRIAQGKPTAPAAAVTPGEILAVLRSRKQAPELETEAHVAAVLHPPPPPPTKPADKPPVKKASNWFSGAKDR
jgi:hypothetical protein